MDQYIIKGGNPLVGEVEIGGAKNAALAILAAAIMTDDTVRLENLPDVNDINVLLEAIGGIGAKVERVDRHTAVINGSTIGDISVDYEYIKKIRASYYLLGALLGKYKKAEVPLPGGCNIGSRPIDLHLKGFRALGATVDIKYGAIVACRYSKLPEQHGCQYQGCRYGCDPYPRCGDAAQYKLFDCAGYDRGRNLYVRCSGNTRRYSDQKCNSETSGSDYSQIRRNRM